MFKKTIFMSGATGFIGSHLAAKFLKIGYKVIALSRMKNNIPARQRLLQAINAVDPELYLTEENLIDIEGDMEDDLENWMFQIKEKNLDEIDEVWHLAAIFKIKKQTQNEVESVNINGVRKILQLVKTINNKKTPRYFHISTAYSQGKSTDTLCEDIEKDKNVFRTLYDWSKYGGEKAVQDEQKRSNLDVTILRPSIVVSSYGSKLVYNAAYYTVLETFYSITKRAKVTLGDDFDGNIGIRYWCIPESKLNVIPVDFAVNAMHLISVNQKLRSQKLKIFNIINENAPSIRQITRIYCESLNITGIDLVSDKSIFDKEPMSPLERLFNRSIAFQAPYTRENVKFSVDHFRKVVPEEILPTPVVDDDFLRDINRHFIEAQEKKLSEKKSAVLA